MQSGDNRLKASYIGNSSVDNVLDYTYYVTDVFPPTGHLLMWPGSWGELLIEDDSAAHARNFFIVKYFTFINCSCSVCLEYSAIDSSQMAWPLLRL